MKKFLSFVCLTVFTFLLVACGGEKKEASNAEAKVEKRVVKVSTKFVDDEQTIKSLRKVIDGINERSNGELELQLFSSGTLPIGKDGMEQLVNGADWILVEGINFLGDYVPDYNAVTGPFLYTSFEEFFRMMASPLVQDLNAQAYEKGIKVLSLDWVFGFRNMTTNKVIVTPEDAKGLKIRVPTSQLYTFTIEAMGASPVAMPYPDTYAAIQQKVIDGVESSTMSYYGTKQYENVKNVSRTRHLLGVSAVMISRKLWDSLSDELKTIIEEEVAKGTADNLAETEKLEKQYEDELVKLGVQFNEVDAEAFQKAAAVVFTKFPKWTPGIYDKIMENLTQIREDIKNGK